MEEYRMGLSGRGKIVWVNRCSFCAMLRVTDQCICDLGLPTISPCGRYEECQDVSSRVDALLHQLPNGYGKSMSRKGCAT